jgi:hypothetical protein
MERRISIATLMAVVFLGAIDCRAIRSILYQEGGPTDALLSTAGMVVLNVLGIGMFSLRRRLGRGEAAPFLVAFEIVGGSCLLGYSLAAVFVPDLLLRHFLGVWRPYINYMAASRIGMTAYFRFTVESALMLYFAMALLVPATIAGLCVRCWGRYRSGREGRANSLIRYGPDDTTPPERTLQRTCPVAGLLVIGDDLIGGICFRTARHEGGRAV